MSLIITRNFKRAKAQDAAAQDIKLPFIITFNNGKKEFREGYSEEEVRRRFDKSVAALYGGIKSVKLEGEDKRNGKDSIAADAKFKVGDKVKYTGRSALIYGKTGSVGTIKSVDTHLFADGYPLYEVEFPGARMTDTIGEEHLRPANSRAADAGDAVARNAASDELNVGDKIWITQYGRNYPYTITKKWKEGWTVWYKAKNDKSGKEEIVAGAFANALDAAAKDKAPDGWWEGKTIFAAFGWGKSVKGKVVSHRGGVIKLEDGTQFKESDAYDLYAIDSTTAGDATTRKFKPNDLVEWRDAHGRHNSAFYVRDNGDRVTVSIEKDGQGGGLEIPKAWITNSRATDAAAQDAGVPNDLAFAVGAIENAIERYSKTFSRYEDDLEEKDFKRYNAIFHAAVNMYRAIQSA